MSQFTWTIDYLDVDINFVSFLNLNLKWKKCEKTLYPLQNRLWISFGQNSHNVIICKKQKFRQIIL